MDDVELGRRILAQGLLPREVLTAAYARRGSRTLGQVLLQDRLLSAEHLRQAGTPASALNATFMSPAGLGWDTPLGDVTRLDDDGAPDDGDLEATQLDLNPPDASAASPPAANWDEATRDPEASSGNLGERTLIDNTVLTPPTFDLARMRAADAAAGADVTRMDGAASRSGPTAADAGDVTRMDDAPKPAAAVPVDDVTRMDPALPPTGAGSADDMTFAPGMQPHDATFAPGVGAGPAGSGSSFGGTGLGNNDLTFAPGMAPVHPGGSASGSRFGQPAPGHAGGSPTFAELGAGPSDATFADAGASYETAPVDVDATFADVSLAGEASFTSQADVVVLPRKPGETGQLGVYTLLEELGRGGMGAVYRARDPAGRDVAVKVIIGEFYSDTIKERFVREGQVTAALNHPGIVRVLGAGTAGKTPYLVYELVEGAQSFKSIYDRLPRDRQVELLRDAARALEAAHSRGVLHRDVKPDNLLVDRDGNVRVADFGLAAGKDLDRLTRTGAQLGTPAYMAPEQIDARREDLGPPTDVWALGVMLYEILTGERPFKGKSFKDLCLQITAPNPTLPRKVRSDVPRNLEAICMRCLTEEASGRYASAGALADDLDRALRNEDVVARAPSRFSKRTKRLAGAGFALALAGSALALYAALSGVTTESRERDLTIMISTPRDDGEVSVPTVEVTGRVHGAAEWVVVRVDMGLPATDALAPPPIRVRVGEVFRVAFSVPGGKTRVRVFAHDEADPELSAEPVERMITYVSGPKWYRKLPPAERPPVIPGILVPSSIAGEYTYLPDDSVLVWIPPGSFTQGPMDGLTVELSGQQSGQFPGEFPNREVTISRGFYLGKYEVSVGQWERYSKETGAKPPVRKINVAIVPGDIGKSEWLWGDGEDYTFGETHPVLNLSNRDARNYCEWAGLRLPTEAEWEYAACGGERIRYPWGDEEPSHKLTNMQGREDGFPYTSPRSAFPTDRSPFGIMNMAGNVTEHVADYYANFPEGDVTDPVGPDSGTHRVRRGGAWSLEFANNFMVFTRDSYEEHDTDWRCGFRVALTPPQR